MTNDSIAGYILLIALFISFTIWIVKKAEAEKKQRRAEDEYNWATGYYYKEK